MASTDLSELIELARKLRGALIDLSHRKKIPHLGGSLSCVELLVACYGKAIKINPINPLAPDRDRFILSKGHAATTLYATLAFFGFFDVKELDALNENGSRLPEHPSPQCVPGVEAATGSLGHGLPIGLGMALASRIQSLPFHVYVVMSDGECNEGSVWEAAGMAAAQRMNNLTALIDFNKWQATGRSTEVMALNPLREKWNAFGWDAEEVDGHDLNAIVNALERQSDRPKAIVAHTVKGKGVSFMEDDNNWHYRTPNDDEARRAKQELGLL